MSKATSPNAKTGKVFLLIAVLLIAAGVITGLAFGPAVSTDHMTYKRYTAAIPYKFDMETLPALSDAINEAAGIPVEVNVVDNLVSGKSILEILVVPADDIDEQAVVTMLGEKYEEMKIESLSGGTYAPALTAKRFWTLVAVYTGVMLLTFILCSFILDGKNAAIILIGMLMATLLTVSLYFLCRVPYLRALIAAVLVVCTMTPYLSIVKLWSLRGIVDKMKKPSSAMAVSEEKAKASGRHLDLLVIIALVSAAFAVAGIVIGTLPIAYFGIMLFAGVACSVYIAALVTPVLWAGFHKK